MIKKLIGILVAVAVIAVIVVAALHHDKYTSMIPSNPSKEAVVEMIQTTVETPAGEISAETPADSVTLHAADSVAQ